eukprot:g79710.t1
MAREKLENRFHKTLIRAGSKKNFLTHFGKFVAQKKRFPKFCWNQNLFCWGLLPLQPPTSFSITIDKPQNPWVRNRRKHCTVTQVRKSIVKIVTKQNVFKETSAHSESCASALKYLRRIQKE